MYSLDHHCLYIKAASLLPPGSLPWGRAASKAGSRPPDGPLHQLPFLGQASFLVAHLRGGWGWYFFGVRACVCVCACAGGGQRQKADLKSMLSPRSIWKVTNLLAFWDGTLCVSVCVRAHVCHCTCTCMCGSRCACKGVHERTCDCMRADHMQDGRCVDVCVHVCGVGNPRGLTALESEPLSCS